MADKKIVIRIKRKTLDKLELAAGILIWCAVWGGIWMTFWTNL